MNTIEVINGKEKTSFQVPADWNELTQPEFIEVVKNMPNLSAGNFSDTLLQCLLSLDDASFDKISSIQKYYLKQSFQFLMQKIEIKRLIIQSFNVNNIEYVGYQAGFSNTTWEEFIYADQYFMNNQYLHAIAVLYRERKTNYYANQNKFLRAIAVLYRKIKPNYDGQSDIRIPFSIYGTEKRLKNIQQLDKDTISAIILNYKVLRDCYIIDKYPHVFTRPSSDEDEPFTDNSGNSFSWVTVHRNMLGEHFFQEDEILQTKVHTVLHRMNAVIEENKKRKK